MNWFVRKGGSNNNGGSSTSLTAERSGTDMQTFSANSNIVSTTANFTSADIGKGIRINNTPNANFKTHCRIVSVTNSTTAVVDASGVFGDATNQGWSIGGAVANLSSFTGTSSSLGTGQSGTLLTAGDQIVIGAGVYREITSYSQSLTGSQVKIYGDVDGVLTGDVGEVQITAHLTDDKTAASTSTLLSVGSKNFWAFENISFISGTNTTRIAAFVDATNISFTNCSFNACGAGGATSTNVITHAFTTAGAHNIVYDKCLFYSSGTNFLQFTLPTSASADYDSNVVIKNCLFIGNANIVSVSTSGANSFKGGGVYAYNCTSVAGGTVVSASGVTNISTTYPVKVENSVFHTGTNRPFNTGTSGSVVEDYNVINATTTLTNTNVTNGTHSVYTGYAPLLSFGQEKVWGVTPRPVGAPLAGSPLLGWAGSSNVQTTDILGVTRPGSSLAAVGAYERSNQWVKETSTVRTGSNAISMTGPGYQDFLVPVDATSTTTSVYVRYDSTYAGTKPSMRIRNGTECGVADATATATGSANTWEQLTLTFTPTSKGIITVRLLSESTAATGKAFADDWSVT